MTVPSTPPERPERRLPLIDPESASRPVAEALHLLPAINLFRAMANADTLYPSYIRYVKLLFGRLEVDPALERLIVLRVAKRSDCLYAWRQNVVVARSVGVPQELIDALEGGRVSAEPFDDRHRAAFAFVDEAMDLVEVTDPTYAEAKRYFSDKAITEMLYLIGTYMFISRLARTGRVPLDDRPADAPPIE